MINKKIGEIKQNDNNPRIIKDRKYKKLVNSIKQFPEMLNIRPIVVDSDMCVLGGNMRLKACADAGLHEIPVIIAENLSDEQKKEFIIKDNVGYGEWDWEILGNEWDIILLDDWGLDVPDFGNDDDAMLSEGSQKAYTVTAECDSEDDQQSIFKLLTSKGYACKKN